MDNTYDINAEINGEAHRRLIEALGTLTLNGIQNAARADVTQRALGGAENSYQTLFAEVEKLKAAVAQTDGQLISELDRRGYDVVKRAETLEEASPVPPGTAFDVNETGYVRRKPGIGVD